MWIWYPIAPAVTAAAEPALPGAWGERRAEALAMRFGADVAQMMRGLHVNARTNAPIVSGTARLPVVLFTPGLGWLPTDYSVLLEDLASHGYIVIGLASPGFAEIVRFEDGRQIRRTLGIGAAIGADQTHLFDDAAFALRQIRQPDGGWSEFLGNRLDSGRIGTLGHSIGGITSVVVAARDSSVVAAVNLDGDPMGEALDVRPRQPLLLVSSESPDVREAPSEPSTDRLAQVQQGLERSEKRRTDDWARMSGSAVSAHRILLAGTRHLNFTDIALASSLLVTRRDRWMKLGPIAPDRGLATTAALVRGFFGQTLLGADDGLLRSPHRQYPEAALETVPE